MTNVSIAELPALSLTAAAPAAPAHNQAAVPGHSGTVRPAARSDSGNFPIDFSPATPAGGSK